MNKARKGKDQKFLIEMIRFDTDRIEFYKEAQHKIGIEVEMLEDQFKYMKKDLNKNRKEDKKYLTYLESRLYSLRVALHTLMSEKEELEDMLQSWKEDLKEIEKAG